MTNTHGRFSPDTREFPICIHCQDKLCKNCGVRKVSIRGQGKNGNVYYNPTCTTCRHGKTGYVDTRTSREKSPWKTLSLQIRQEVGVCERCGFVPEHLGQLDTDHIDGNPDNHERSNLKVLCSNCHRLKTIQSVDWIKTMNKRYQENTGQRRPTPTEYMRTKRSKATLQGVTPITYLASSLRDKVRIVKALTALLSTKEDLKLE